MGWSGSGTHSTKLTCGLVRSETRGVRLICTLVGSKTHGARLPCGLVGSETRGVRLTYGTTTTLSLLPRLTDHPYVPTLRFPTGVQSSRRVGPRPSFSSSRSSPCPTPDGSGPSVAVSPRGRGRTDPPSASSPTRPGGTRTRPTSTPDVPYPDTRPLERPGVSVETGEGEAPPIKPFLGPDPDDEMTDLCFTP